MVRTFEGALRAQNDVWEDFVTAALAQGRANFPEGTEGRGYIDAIPTQPATRAPGQAEITVATSPAPTEVHLEFTAPHATSFQVWHKGPNDEGFSQVADVLLPGVYDAIGLSGGEDEYKIIGENSRGDPAVSESVTSKEGSNTLQGGGGGNGGGSPKGDRNHSLPQAVPNRSGKMTHTNPSEESKKNSPKKRRFLSAEKKFQIYLEAQSNAKPIGELLRREGLFSTDLARIREHVKEGALQRLSAKPGKKQYLVGTEVYEALKRELQDKERAMADLSVELAILRKKTNGGSWDR
ncbi:MAG: hypothetical protein EXS31_08055 [Pedosphaera sp.]|nr:hypothetical protein [Pedosphaera sp.]